MLSPNESKPIYISNLFLKLCNVRIRMAWYLSIWFYYSVSTYVCIFYRFCLFYRFIISAPVYIFPWMALGRLMWLLFPRFWGCLFWHVGDVNFHPCVPTIVKTPWVPIAPEKEVEQDSNKSETRDRSGIWSLIRFNKPHGKLTKTGI